jgi:hypothetical protein
VLVAIGQIVIGGLLLCCSGFGLVNNVAIDSSATVTITKGGKTTTQVYDTREEMEREAPGYQSVLLFGGVADLLLHAAMIVGAAGMLRSHAWGWWLSLAWAVLRLAFQIATQYYVWFVCMPACNRVVQAVPHDDAHVCGQMANGNTAYHALWGLASLALALYPLVILVLLLLPPFWRAFASGEDDEDAGPSRRREREEERRPVRRREEY